MSGASADRATVVIASRLFVPEVSAGAFRLGALARGLVSAGAAAEVVTTIPPRHAPAADDPPGVRVRRWPVLRDRGGNVRGYVQYLSFDAPLLLRILFRPWRVAVAESPPTTGLVVALAAAVRRRPFAYYAADVWTDGVISMGAARPVVSLMRAMETAVLRSAAVTLSVSDEVTERLVLLGADRTRIATIGNGIDTGVFTPDAEPAAPGERYFVYTGTMSEWQQPDVFVRAFAQIAGDHPEVRLRFFGQGAVQERLQRLAAELVPGRVEFGGVVSPAESARWIRGAVASLVSIVPGIGYDFARPTKSYAAAACGTPVLYAGAHTGGALVRDNELGEAVAFETAAVAAAMHDLLAQQRAGETERRRAERAAWARETVSLDAVGERAAAAVLSALGTSEPGASPAAH
ncbi:glycosyltransferase [Microbacterium hominis]|uniref:D-inositol 3-phosphate glycosyltransferase n=1 Tax=Microbacterium hominis TaxID=162426 RepID=A0A7D4UGR7_9MICO|nr:glycosyltransferase [Microbacterium hominis]QKJ20029.1 glycosyltransferase [Microbacterium hominis]